jgi:hypothetical protein
VQLVRPAFALHPRRFGRGPARAARGPAEQVSSPASDLKLFAATFLAGFLFVSILIG